MKSLAALTLSVLMLAGCGAVELSDVQQNAVGPATVKTDAASYFYNDNVLVSWSGLNGNQNDWVAIAPAGSPLTTVTRWAYTSGAVNGEKLFEGPATGGSYVARAFDNDSYTLMGESDPFTMADPTTAMATISFDQTDYAIDQAIVLSFSGMPGSPNDWVSVAIPGSGDTQQVMWKYTGGGTSGTVTFARGLGPTGRTGGGNYIARAYVNNSYFKVAETASSVLIGSTVTTNANTYTTNQRITVTWTHLPGGSNGDWIAIAPQGAASDVFTTWMFTGGQQNGSVTFEFGVDTVGTYVARAMSPQFYYISGESAPFTVTPGAAVTVTTDMSTYTVGQDITVTWSGTPGNNHDWIAIAPNGSSDTTVTRWVYTNGQASGSYTFEGAFQGVPAGTYVARAFLDDKYVKIGQSSTFTVN